MMRRLLCAGLLAILLSAPAGAQIIAQRTQLVSLTTSGTDCSVSTSCAVLSDVFRTSGVGFQISTITSATIQFEGTVDGTNWVAISVTPVGTTTTVTSATGTGMWFVQPAVLQGVRMRASANATPPTVVSIIAR